MLRYSDTQIFRVHNPRHRETPVTVTQVQKTASFEQSSPSLSGRQGSPLWTQTAYLAEQGQSPFHSPCNGYSSLHSGFGRLGLSVRLRQRNLIFLFIVIFSYSNRVSEIPWFEIIIYSEPRSVSFPVYVTEKPWIMQLT